MSEKIFKVGDLVIPTSFSNYKTVYPAKMIVEVIETERAGKPVIMYRLEDDETDGTGARRGETLELVSEA